MEAHFKCQSVNGPEITDGNVLTEESGDRCEAAMWVVAEQAIAADAVERSWCLLNPRRLLLRRPCVPASPTGSPLPSDLRIDFLAPHPLSSPPFPRLSQRSEYLHYSL